MPTLFTSADRIQYEPSTNTWQKIPGTSQLSNADQSVVYNLSLPHCSSPVDFRSRDSIPHEMSPFYSPQSDVVTTRASQHSSLQSD